MSRSVKIHAPIPRPAKNILCVGKNYHDHAREFHASGFDASAGKDAIPDVPIMFTKWPNSVIGPGEPIPSSNDYTGSTDYEGELAVVIGEGGRNIEEERRTSMFMGTRSSTTRPRARCRTGTSSGSSARASMATARWDRAS